MVKTRSQTENITIKKEEQEDCKPTLVLNGVTNTRSSGRITKRKPPVTNNRSLPALQVKLEQDTDTKALLKSESNSSNSASKPRISQEQINQLIDYVVNDNMSIIKAARKAKISKNSGFIYYNLYKNDPEKRIPLARNQQPVIFYTQEQISNLIKYIDTDKMTVKEASAKANMAYKSGRRYYAKYLKDPNHNIPIPRLARNYTQDQKNKVIGYIINDKMSITAASKKAKMNFGTAQRYYHNYFKVQNPGIARPSHIATNRTYTQEQIKEVISYIVNDKMTIAAASRKANISPDSAGKYYRQYLIDNNMKIPISKTSKRYTQDEINKFIGYIVDGKMSVLAASRKANIHQDSLYRFYHKYCEGSKA
jgi:hypothetical protein